MTWLIALLACAVTDASAQRRARAPARQWRRAVGIHAGDPTKVSVALGGFRVTRRGDTNHGQLALVEPGLHGLKVRVGVATVGAFYSGYSLEIAGLRTFDSPVGAAPRTSYIGGEAHLRLAILNLGVGAYRALNTVVRDQSFAAISVGLGF